MRIKLFNGSVTVLHLTVLGGGYDQDSGRVQLIVRGEADNIAGTMLLEINEAHRVAALMLANTPKPIRVEAAIPDELAIVPDEPSIKRRPA